ncbi:MAG: crossover junction endodeoxyribonuclease RuvC [Myxococcaceae bacterium]|nr:crossover junction endodeoxyribonuclease RuvC [Myxococcaceae bacterium]MBH2006740.1 crossover junction endodeoxyribonuclease RuvC [Myxococcaceae bacterium]
MTRIVGIDPGSRKVGIGILEHHAQTRNVVVLHHQVLRLDLSTELPARLSELSFRLQEVLNEYKPDRAVLEDVFVGDHARSALILGQARGAVLAVLGLHRTPVTSIAARRVKQIITGQGNATKLQMGEMVRVLLKLPKRPAEDASDALALALTYIHFPVNASLALTDQPPKTSIRKGLYELAKSQGLVA